MTLWLQSWRCDPVGRALADRHYNRQSIGARDFMPPGACVVFTAIEGDAVWGSSWPLPEYVKHDWPGAWVNSLFRRESGPLASELIRSAVAATLAAWGEPPLRGMVTFVDPKKVREKRHPGYCYLMAGFKLAGQTKGGLDVLQMPPRSMPEPCPALSRQLTLA